MGFLQGKTGTVASGSTVSFNSNTTANSLLIVVMSDTTATNSSFALTDSTDQNNTWTVLTSAGQYPTLSIAYALSTKGGSTDTIKITRPGGGTVNYSIGEYSGVTTFRAATPFAQNGNGTLSPLKTTSLSTTTGDLLLLVGGFLSANNDGPLTPAVTVREGSFTTSSTPTAYGDAMSSGGSVAGSVAVTFYYSVIILLDFYQASTGVPNSLAMMGCGI